MIRRVRERGPEIEFAEVRGWTMTSSAPAFPAACWAIVANPAARSFADGAFRLNITAVRPLKRSGGSEASLRSPVPRGELEAIPAELEALRALVKAR
jgi:hypothetical protein